MARVQSFLGDFRAALQNEKSTYSIYNSKVWLVCVCVCARVPYIIVFLQFGCDNERTKESSECLEELTQKAVTMQKTVSSIPSHTPSVSVCYCCTFINLDQ